MKFKVIFYTQGQNASGRVGIFPATCVAHIHNNERILQIVQNVCLMDGSKSLRLYRDQVTLIRQFFWDSDQINPSFFINALRLFSHPSIKMLSMV